ncbi:MAG: glutamyl-tRNA reductase [Candidatus Saccharibacteria bacterium]|nr:glutamyl-tRNA reductase [Moraxellaceae bacterium]
MGFFALGINHTTAPLALREQVAFVPEHLGDALRHAQTLGLTNDLVIVSTCNRTELYSITDSPDDLVAWLALTHGLSIEVLADHLYQHGEEDALIHLMRVASGIDSMVIGEPQILGQVKSALQYARDAGTVTPKLTRIFEHVFSAAKKVRTETAIGAQAVSLGFAVLQLARQMFSDLGEIKVLLVAAGEMNTLVGRHLAEHGVKKILICNRSIERANRFADELQSHVTVEVIPFDQLESALQRADLVSSSTGSLHPVITREMVRRALKTRRHRPMLMIDLAVPRDIESHVTTLDDVYLYTVDDLQGVIEGNLAHRRQAAVEAEVMVSQLAAQYVQNNRAQQAGPEIAHYRQEMDQIRQQEVVRAKHLLEQGVAVDEVLERLSQAVMAKLLHRPSQLIREAAIDEDSERLEWITKGLGNDE